MNLNNEFQTFEELLGFHNSNSKAFSGEAVKMVSELQSVNAGLRALVKSWSSVKTQVSENIDQQDENKVFRGIAVVQRNGSLFDEVAELEKIGLLKVKLRLIANELLSNLQWLQTVNDTMRQFRMNFRNVVTSGEASDETFLMLWEAGVAFLQFESAACSLRIALGIIGDIDFSSEILYSDLCGPKIITKLLRFTSELLEKATKDASEALLKLGLVTKEASQTEKRKMLNQLWRC